MPTWTGKTLNKVEIGSLIARGGMAEVYEGDHANLNRKVAIKIMRDHVDTDLEMKTRFEREARVVAGMRHQNIIQVYDYDVIEGQPCLIMEYIPGASLAGYMKALHHRGEKIPFNIVAKIIKELAAAIDYAHSLNIVHRDIKPANVLLRSAGGPVDASKPLPEDVEPILTDFGLVRLLDASTQTSTGTVSGTPTYMSPEQARGDKVDARTDIYSFGVMIYEMLAGAVPFESESSFGLLMKHLNEPPPAISGISTDLQAVIDRALSKDPAFRYPTATAFVDEFIGVFNGQTVSINTLTQLKGARQAMEKPRGLPLPSWLTPSLLKIGGGIFAAAFVIGMLAIYTTTNIKNTPVAQVTYTDFNSTLDKANITITDLKPLRAGTHYQAWYLAQGGEVRLNIGEIKTDDNGQGQLTYVDAESRNILAFFDQMEITVEPDNDPSINEPSDQVAASFVYPPLAFTHVRHLLVAFNSTPNKTALVQGLWFGTDQVATSVDELQAAFDANNEVLVRQKTEEIINQLAGNANTTLYKDWDENGTIEDPGDGYGLLQNGEPGYNDQGYISQTIAHANFSASAQDATETIKTNSLAVAEAAKNVEGWTRQLLEKAVRLSETPFGNEMTPLIAEINVLSKQIVLGVDSNGNQIIEPIVGEGGASTVYDFAYNTSLMQLLPGEHRLPPPASK
jgi:serine/threonine protein kinase